MKHKLIRLFPGLLALSLALTACSPGGAASSSSSGGAASSSAAERPNYSLGLADNGRYEGISALDYVTLPQGYDQIQVGEDYHAAPEADVQAAVDQYMAQFSETVEITDRAVEAGDLVNLDYVGYIDGVAFDGGNTQGQGAEYTAGSSQLIDDFLDQIIGVMPGDTVDVQVTFPDPYPNNTDLSGKEATFVTTVNFISQSETPELTDEFVAQYLTETFGYTSVADLREKLAASLLEEHQYNYVLDWLYDNCQFQEVPQSLIQNQMDILSIEMENAAAAYQVDVDTLAQSYGMEGRDALMEAYRPSLENLIRQNLMCQALAEAEGIEVTQQSLGAYFEEVMGFTDYSAYENQYGLGYLSQLVQMEMTAQYLLDHVVR